MAYTDAEGLVIMPASIELNLYTDHPEHAIDAASLLTALQSSLDLLHELDAGVSGGKCQWRYISLGIGSGLSTVVGTLPADIDEPDARERLERKVATRYIEGLSALESSPMQQPGFTPKAIEAALRIASVLSDGISRIETAVPGAPRVWITEHLITNIKELLGHNFTDIGSVEGRLETISLTGGRPTFTIRSELTTHPVTCSLGSRLEEVRAFLGRRVLVSGEVTYSRYGELSEVSSVRSIRLLAESNVPTVDDIAGIAPDITDGQPSGTYVRKRFDPQRVNG